jgi:hypothetical protein
MVTKKNIKINKCWDTITKRLYDDISVYKKRGKNKISMDDFEIPLFENYENIININYNVKQLKKTCKAYNLKISGCKNQLQYRIYNYLKYSYYGQKIQKVFRGSIVRRLNKLKGPAYLNRNCINETDFLMFENVKSINNEQFFSFKDKDGFVYGFNICSIYNLLFVENKTGVKKSKNPYNRNEIPQKVCNDVRNMVQLSKILKFDTSVEVKNETDLLSFKKKVELKCADIFQKIDEMGNTTHYSWFYNLNKQGLLKFINELIDIWKYRLNLSKELKMEICPPIGKPFHNLRITSLFSENIDKIRNGLLNIINTLITSSQQNQLKSLGAYYVLGSLTLVSHDAANSMPWLYETFRY